MLISIEGIAHAGKSELIKSLLSSKIVHVSLSNSVIENEDPMTELWRRAKDRADVQDEISKHLSDNKHVLVESYDLWFRAHCMLNGHPKLAKYLARTVIRPHIVLHLNVDIATAMNRESRPVFNQHEERRLLAFYIREPCAAINTAKLSISQTTSRTREIMSEHQT